MGLSLNKRAKHALVTALFVIGVTLPLAAQQATTVLREPPIPLLPQHFTGWDRQGDAVTGQDPNAADAPNAAVLKEDGLTRFATATYTHTPGKAILDATAMQFVDATAAFSVFTFYRSQLPHAHVLTGPAKLGSDSVQEGDTLLVRAGTAILRARGAASPKELLALVSALPKVGGSAGLAPLLPTYVPATGLIPASVRYAIGPTGYAAMGGLFPPSILDFEKSGEALTANYAGATGKGTLTLLLYPTPQIAGDSGRAIEKALNAPGGHATLGTVRMRRVGPLLGVATGSFTPDQAETLVASLHLNQEITFDKRMPPEFHAEVRKTASLLQNILLFCGVLAAAAVLLALFLGGARAGWRVLHGKPAASEPEFLTINLHSQPKAFFVPATAPPESAKPE